MSSFKKTLKKGINIISIPTSKPIAIEKVFGSDISGAIFWRLSKKGKWIDKEEVNFVNHHFETKKYKILNPFEVLKIDLPQDITIDWDIKFMSHTTNLYTKIEFEEGFDYKEALHLANLSSLVYKEEDEIYEILEKYYDYEDYRFYDHAPYDNDEPFEDILNLIKYFDKQYTPVDLQFLRLSKYDSKKQHVIIFVFRGSKVAQDWLVNFKSSKEDFLDEQSEGDVHRGFHSELEKFVDIMRNDKIFKLEERACRIDEISKNTKILLAGHSKGGAIATLVGCYLAKLGISKANLEIYTFGAPPVGDREFANLCKDRVNLFRVVNKNDPVPILSTIVGFKNFGKEIILDGGDENNHDVNDYINNLMDKVEEDERYTQKI